MREKSAAQAPQRRRSDGTLDSDRKEIESHISATFRRRQNKSARIQRKTPTQGFFCYSGSSPCNVTKSDRSVHRWCNHHREGTRSSAVVTVQTSIGRGRLRNRGQRQRRPTPRGRRRPSGSERIETRRGVHRSSSEPLLATQQVARRCRRTKPISSCSLAGA